MNSNLFLSRLIPRTAAVCATSAGVVALAGSALWWSGQWRQATFGDEYVPMAPSTALLMLLLSIAAGLRSMPLAHRAARVAEAVCTLLALIGGALFGLQFPGIAMPIESWLSGTSETVGGIPVGRMSPLTAGCFVLVALALFCGRPTEAIWRPLRSLGGWLSLAVLLLGGIVVAGYLCGRPFLYGGTTIPMAMLTGLAFLLLSLATLLAAGCDAWPMRMFLRRSAESAGGALHQVEWSLLILFLGLASGITVVGLLYLNQQQANARSVAHAELEAIADLKVQQLVNWRNERLGDGRFFSQAAFVRRDVARLLATPGDATIEAEVLQWLTLLKAGQRYERVTIFDSQSNPRLSIPPGTDGISPTLGTHLLEALRSNRVIMADLHRHDAAEEIHLDLLVPVLPPRELPSISGPSAGEPGPPLAVIHLEIDPRRFLYPLVQSWPTPSPTAETLLVRREGLDVLYLNELRHQPGTAMTLRRPLDEARSPAAMGIRGTRGIHEGLDYRGVPVAAVVRPVPDTAWFMVAKVDEVELYAPLQQQALAVGAMMLSLLMAATFGVTVFSRRRDELFLRAQLSAEQERRVLAERYEHLMKHASDAVLLTDAQWHILEANDRAVQAYGWTLTELQGMSLPDLHAPESSAEFARRTMPEREWVLFETVHRRTNATVFPVELGASRVTIGGVEFELVIVRDITQRKAHEAEIERLNRLHATLSQVNQTIARCQNREELFADIARVIVDTGRFKTAWIGWRAAGTQTLTRIAHRASDENPGLELPGWNHGCGMMAEALETGRPCLCNGAPTDKRAACCRHVQDGLGVQSCGAFPLRLREEVRGAFCLTSADPDFFNAGEIRLLEEVAYDVSFALDKLDKEEQRQRAEEARRRAEADLQLALEAGRLGDWSWNIVTGEIVWSARCKALHGLPPETVMTYEGFLGRVHPDDRARVEAALTQAVKGRTDYVVEKRVVWPDGSLHWNSSRARVFCDEAGHPVRMAGVTFDITERKHTEELLSRRAEELRLRNQELTRFNRASVDRELRMIELKKLVNELCLQLGQPPRFPLSFGQETNEPTHG